MTFCPLSVNFAFSKVHLTMEECSKWNLKNQLILSNFYEIQQIQFVILFETSLQSVLQTLYNLKNRPFYICDCWFMLVYHRKHWPGITLTLGLLSFCFFGLVFLTNTIYWSNVGPKLSQHWVNVSAGCVYLASVAVCHLLLSVAGVSGIVMSHHKLLRYFLCYCFTYWH